MNSYKLKIEGRSIEVNLDSLQQGRATATVDGRTYEVEIEDGAPVAVASGPAPRPVTSRPSPTPKPHTVPSVEGGNEIRAPMPGQVLDVMVNGGDRVEAKQVVVKMETMKMENEIRAPRAGTVRQVHVRRDEDVEQGRVLVTLEE